MEIKEDLKNSAKLLVSAASDAAQALVDKSRLRAQAVRVKQVIKNEREIQNQAYIELGRYFYENLRENANSEQEELCSVIDTTTKRIDKASMKYLELIAQSGDTKLSSENAEKLRKIMAKKAADLKESTTDKVTELKDKAKDFSTDTAMKAKDFTVEKAQQAKQAVLDIKEDIKSRVISQDELDAMIEEQKAIIAELEAVKAEGDDAQADSQSEVETPDVPTHDAEVSETDEESPQDFDF